MVTDFRAPQVRSGRDWCVPAQQPAERKLAVVYRAAVVPATTTWTTRLSDTAEPPKRLTSASPPIDDWLGSPEPWNDRTGYTGFFCVQLLYLHDRPRG